MPSRIAHHAAAMVRLSATPLRAALGACALALLLTALWAPLVQTARGYPAGEGAYRALTRICHQYPSRCVWMAGRPMALCARCAAAYLGIVIAAVAIPRVGWRRHARLAGVALVAAAAVEPLGHLLGGGESNLILRLILGIAGGIGMCLALFPHMGPQTGSR